MTTTTTLDDFPTATDGTVRHTVSVDAAHLIRLLRAVLPHTDGTEDLPVMHRIRVDVGDHDITAIATSTYTAVVGHLADPDDTGTVDTGTAEEAWSFDLLPADVKDIARMFKPGKDEQITLRLDLRADDRLTVTDSSGLFDGRAYTIPTVAGGEHFPDVRKLIRDQLDARRGKIGTVTYTGDLLRRFAASAAAYGDALHIAPIAEARPFLVMVGDALIGLLMPRRNDDELADGAGSIAQAWRDRL